VSLIDTATGRFITDDNKYDDERCINATVIVCPVCGADEGTYCSDMDLNVDGVHYDRESTMLEITGGV